jgi:hypothetical protein
LARARDIGWLPRRVPPLLAALLTAAARLSLAGPDCNGNGLPDGTDIAVGTSLDCDVNGVPDECDTDVTFTFHPISNLADGPASAFVADLDGDGDLDVLSASFNDDRIAWYPNVDGRGQFGPQQTIAADADGAVTVVAADLDGDADMDVLSAAFQGEIVWYENLDGVAGHFEARLISNQVPAAWSVAAADLDGDGDLDVLSASQNDNKIAWYENTDGAGSYGAQRVITLQADIPRAVTAADLDGDGDADVASASYGDNAVRWYENSDGHGTFGPPQLVSTAGAGAAYVFPGDVDGDADVDLLAASSLDGEVAWHEKLDGLDGFGPQQIIFDDATLALWVVGADLDGDGDLDVVSASLGDDTIAWHENLDGAGGFGPRRVVTSAAFEATSVVAGDLDRDGDVDLVVTAQANDAVAWYENLGDDCDGDAVPDACEPDCDGNGRADACDLASGAATDCNANGIPDGCDIAAGSADCTGNGVPDACEPDCDGDGEVDSCEIQAGTSADCTGNAVPDACESDCDGDGEADSCEIQAGTSADCTGNGVPDACEPDCNGNGQADSCEIQSGTSADCDGNGVPDPCDAAGSSPDCDADGVLDVCETAVTFRPQIISTLANFPRSVAGADLDRDGDPDALSASGIDDKVAWYENTDGQGAFGPQQVISTEGDLPVSVLAADLNGDRALDVLSAAFVDDEIAWHEQRLAPGQFGPPETVTQQADGAQSVGAGDLDGDGDADVVAGSFLDGVLAWHENVDGQGSFGPRRVVATLPGSGLFAVGAADVDGDRDLDLLSASFADDTVAWHENLDGAGTFGPRRLVATDADGATSVAGADLDGDGDIDLISAAQGGDRVAWHENLDGAGGFGPPRVLTTFANGATSVIGVDVDGDGARDVLSASFFDNTVAWYRNLDGLGTFGPPQTVTDMVVGAYAVSALDVDGDGDTDVLTASQDDDTIAWHENRSGDCNGNGVPDNCDAAGGASVDCTGNGIPDACERDCNANGIADTCEIQAAPSADCNGNGFLDACEPDCNGNGQADACDVADATSLDCNENGLPDECEADCNQNGVPDDCDVAAGTSPDCNLNGAPDECEGDCNGNGVPDDCDLAQGTSPDCDANVVPDECDPDCNHDGTPDACDTDCNLNRVPDGCEADCNGNGIADACDIDPGPSIDCNGNGVPDECDTACQGPCDSDGDRCRNELDSDPDDSHVCADVDQDGCDDCTSGVVNPAQDGTDADVDGFCDRSDCNPADSTVWADPAPARALSVSASGATTLLAWQPPVFTGALVVGYDTLRSTRPDDFVEAGSCVESDAFDLTSQDATVPAAGAVLHYLVRVENGCAGSGAMGEDSSGTPRVGLPCP